VLSNFLKEEMDRLQGVLDGVIDAMEMLLKEGLPKAMSIHHSKDYA